MNILVDTRVSVKLWEQSAFGLTGDSIHSGVVPVLLACTKIGQTRLYMMCRGTSELGYSLKNVRGLLTVQKSLFKL